MGKAVRGGVRGVGGGCAFQWAMMWDVRVGHEGVRMGEREINAGIPSTLGPWLMIERIGWSRMVELTLSGRMMDARECHHVGLIHYLVPKEEVMTKSLAIAAHLASKPPIAMNLNNHHFRPFS